VGGSDSKTEFALVLFACLMVFNLFSKSVNRAPSLVLENVNYIKKVTFPLEILPVVAQDSAAFHLFIWLIFYLVFFGVPQATIFLLPLELLPLVLMTLGLSWLLASLGMYLRDVTQIIGVVTTMMMFLSPIFYPIVALPEEYRSFMQISPLTPVVEQTHDVMISGKDLDWSALAVYLLLSSMIAWLSFAWFQKTRKRFADVL
jgi:lipopolysaccharide transport system permease protein